jgi:hypothetical protein
MVFAVVAQPISKTIMVVLLLVILVLFIVIRLLAIVLPVPLVKVVKITTNVQLVFVMKAYRLKIGIVQMEKREWMDVIPATNVYQATVIVLTLFVQTEQSETVVILALTA